MKKIITFVGILMLCSQQCNATIIFVTLSRDAIYVGGDGRLTMRDSDGDETYQSGCKIKQLGNIVVAYSGTISESSSGVNAFKILDSIKANSVADFADKAVKIFPNELRQTIAHNTELQNTQSITADIAIVSFESGKPAYIRLMFVNDQNVIKHVRMDEGAEFEKNARINPYMIMGPNPVGEYAAISYSAFAESNCGFGEGIEEQTRCRLKQFIQADPKHINEPISIVKINRDGGVLWLESGACRPCVDKPCVYPT